MATPTTQSTNGQYPAQGTPINGVPFTNPFASQINAQTGAPVSGVNGQVGVANGTQTPGHSNGQVNGQYGVQAIAPYGVPFLNQTLGQPGFGFPVASPFGVPFNGLGIGQFGGQFGSQFGAPSPAITGGFPTLPFGYVSHSAPHMAGFNPSIPFNSGGYPAINPFANTFNGALSTTGFNSTGNGAYGVSPFNGVNPFAQSPFANVPFGTTGFNGVTPFNGVPFNGVPFGTLPPTGTFNTVPPQHGWNPWNSIPAINAWGQNVWGQNVPSLNNWNTGLSSTGLVNNTWGLHNQFPFGVPSFLSANNTYPQHLAHGTGLPFFGTPWSSQAFGAFGRSLTTQPSTPAWNTGFNAVTGTVPSFSNPLFNTPFNTINTPWTTGLQNTHNVWNGLHTWNNPLSTASTLGTLGTVPSFYANTPWNSIPGTMGVNPWTINNTINTPTNGVWPINTQFGAQFGTTLPFGNQFGIQFGGQYGTQFGTQFGLQNCSVLGGDCACPPSVCIPGLQNTVPFAGIQNSGVYGLPFNTILPTGVNPLATGFGTLPNVSNGLGYSVPGTNVLGSNAFGTLPRWTSIYPQNAFSPTGPTQSGVWQNTLPFSQSSSPFNPFTTAFNQSVPFAGNTAAFSTFNPYALTNPFTSPVLNTTPIGNGFYSPIFGVPSFGIPSFGAPSFGNGYVQTSPNGSVLTSVAGGVNGVNAFAGFNGFPYASNPNNPFAPSPVVTNPVTGQTIGVNGQTAGATLVGCCREAA